MQDDIQNELPDPELVARAAAEAVGPRIIDDYFEAIRILREKKFTFRETADWLEDKFGINADHNSVWRAFTKGMTDYEAAMEARADDEVERDEAYEEAMMQPAPAARELIPTEAPKATVEIQ